jgi:2-(1,2-epoxy-1,2-dihydrophenyl)acetyl-CoA isomerase
LSASSAFRTAVRKRGQPVSLTTPENRDYIVDIEDGLLRLTLSRPEQSNAMTSAMTPMLIDLFEAARQRPDVRAIHIRGEGRNLSAGGDVPGFAKTLEMSVADRQEEFRGRIGRLGRLVQAVVSIPGPVVVEMRGGAAGAGLLFALAADYVIGDETSLFVFAHQSLGLCPDGGVSALLPQVVGLRTARALVLTGARVKAEEALRIGLLNRLVDAASLEAEAAKLAARLANAPQLAVRNAKRLLNMSPGQSLGDQMDAETAAVADCVADGDFAEGVNAFLEKRSPDFPSTR